MVAAMSATVAVRSVRPPTGSATTNRSARLWVLATALTSGVIGMLPLLWERRYFFHGDTQVAYSGWWYHLGDQVLKGHLPLLNPRAWESGNYIGEGQWGLFSPLTILVGVALRLSPNAVAVITLLKLGLIVVGAVGTYFLLRSFRLSPAAAYAGGILVGLGGQSVTFDWPSWLTGQMATALLPWAWWLTRRAMRGRNPLPALLACYLVVSVGYVYAAMYLAVVMIVCLVDAGVARDRAALLRVLGIGLFSALIVAIVYLPGIRTAPVTVRAGWDIRSDGRFPVGVSDIFTSMLPTNNYRYLLWCSPLLLWIDAGRARLALRDLRGTAVGAAILFAWVLGPNKIGPLRWPSRVQPALMVVLVVLLVVVAARSLRAPSRARLLAGLGWLAAATWIAVSRDWPNRNNTLLAALVVGAAIVLVAWTLRRGPSLAAAAIGVGTLAAFLVQHSVTPDVGAVDRHSPAAASGYEKQLKGARGEVLVIGNYGVAAVNHPHLSRQLLVGSTWYRNPAQVQNGYSTIRFKAYEDRFCMTYNGLTCPSMLKEVLAVEPTTGRPWADLLSISTLVMYRPQFKGGELDRPPAGWTITRQTSSTVMWVRDHPLPGAGGVAWASAGVRVHQLGNGDRTVRFRVDGVPAGGGDVVLSRLAWPGYTVSGASLAKPTEDMLVTVHVDAAAAGHTVTVSWSPPGWTSEVAAWWLAVVGGLAWSAVLLFGNLRQRRRAGAAVPSAPASAGAGGATGPDEDDAAVEPPPGRRREGEPHDVR